MRNITGSKIVFLSVSHILAVTTSTPLAQEWQNSYSSSDSSIYLSQNNNEESNMRARRAQNNISNSIPKWDSEAYCRELLNTTTTPYLDVFYRNCIIKEKSALEIILNSAPVISAQILSDCVKKWTLNNRFGSYDMVEKCIEKKLIGKE